MFTIRRSMRMIAALHKRFGGSKVSEISNPGVDVGLSELDRALDAGSGEH